MSDEILRIQIDEIGGKNAANTLKNIADKTKEITELLKNVGYGSKEIDTLTKEFNKLSNSIKVYSSAIRDVNKANTNAILSEQKIAQALEKTNSVRIKNTTEIAKQELAQRKANTESARESLIQQRVQTEINKTSLAELRLAQMQEKVSNAIAKASMPLTILNRNLKEQEIKLKSAILANNVHGSALDSMVSKYKRLSGELTRVNTEFNKLTATEQTNLKISEMLSRSLAYFIGNITANFFTNAIYGMRDFDVACSEAGVALDGIRNTFAAGARGWKQGGDEMAYVADMADRLGLNLKGTYEPYAKFMTSFVRSGGTIAQSRQIFEDMSTAMVALHLPAERMEGVFVALEQMANKGTVQAEELKRQLSNALPGAFELAAESMGILPSQLMDMMKAGEVVSKDFLPNFAATVRNALGKQIGIAVDQYNAHINRLQSQTFLLQANLGQLINSAIMPVIKGITSLFREINVLTTGLGENSIAVAAFQVTILGLAGGFVKLLSMIPMVKVGIANLVTIMNTPLSASSFLSFFKGNALAIGIAGVTTALLACHNQIELTKRQFEETAVQQRDVTNNVTGLVAEFTQLQEITNRSTAQQEAYNRTFEDLKTGYPEMLQYMLEHGVNIKTITEAQAEQMASMAVQAKMLEAQKLLVDELGNKWLQFGTWVEKQAKTALFGVQAMCTGIAHAIIALGQVVTRFYSGILKISGEATEKLAFASSKLGAKEMAVQLDNATKSLKSYAAGAWNAGSVAHEKLNSALRMTARDIVDIDYNRQGQAINRYKKTVSELGLEQTKLAKSLMASRAATVGLHEGGDSKSGKSKKGKSDSKASKTKDAWEQLQAEIQKTEELMRVRILNGQSIDDLSKKYVDLKTKQKYVEDGMSKLTAIQKGLWATNQQEITNLEELMRERLMAGLSIDTFAKEYTKLKKQQEAVNVAMQNLNLTPYERLKKQVSELSKEYKNMMLNSSAYTKQQIDNTKKLLRQKESELNYTDAMKNRQNIVEVTKRNAKELGDAFVDAIFDGSETSIQDKFKDIAKSFLKSIATDFSKKMLDSLTSGFALGFSHTSGNLLQRLLGGAVGGAGGLLGKSQNTVLGTITGATSGGGFSFKNAISGLTGQQTGTGVARQQTGGFFGKIGGLFGKLGGMFSKNAGGNTGASSASTLMQNLASQGNILTQTLQSQVIPAASQTVGSIAQMSSPISTAINGLTGMVSPATNTASSLVSMASSTPLAAVGMASMSASMTSLAPAASMAAPSLMQMGTALASIGANASMAATSMAALAVATAANSAAQIPYVGWVLAPVAATLTGAAIAAGTIMTGGAIAASTTLAGAGQMLGGAMSGIGNTLSGGVGNIIPHAKGGVISSPTTFPMSGGNIGLAGEAGTEVIAPARRMANGDLGVGAVAPNVTVNNYTNAAVEVIRRPNNETEVKITELNAMLSSSKTNRGFANAQSRMSQRGRQIG